MGDKVSVYSERFSTWFDDGIVTATFRDRLKVQYGFQKYFGFTFSRGNEKTVMINNLKEVVRPHKLFEENKSGGLRLVTPAVKRRKLDAEAVGVQKTITS